MPATVSLIGQASYIGNGPHTLTIPVGTIAAGHILVIATYVSLHVGDYTYVPAVPDLETSDETNFPIVDFQMIVVGPGPTPSDFEIYYHTGDITETPDPPAYPAEYGASIYVFDLAGVDGLAAPEDYDNHGGAGLAGSWPDYALQSDEIENLHATQELLYIASLGIQGSPELLTHDFYTESGGFTDIGSHFHLDVPSIPGFGFDLHAKHFHGAAWTVIPVGGTAQRVLSWTQTEGTHAAFPGGALHGPFLVTAAETEDGNDEEAGRRSCHLVENQAGWLFWTFREDEAVYVDRSRDHGVTWDGPVLVLDGCAANAAPVLAVDVRDDLYCAFHTEAGEAKLYRNPAGNLAGQWSLHATHAGIRYPVLFYRDDRTLLVGFAGTDLVVYDSQDRGLTLSASPLVTLETGVRRQRTGDGATHRDTAHVTYTDSLLLVTNRYTDNPPGTWEEATPVLASGVRYVALALSWHRCLLAWWEGTDLKLGSFVVDDVATMSEPGVPAVSLVRAWVGLLVNQRQHAYLAARNAAAPHARRLFVRVADTEDWVSLV